jgi:hypothetical protein
MAQVFRDRVTERTDLWRLVEMSGDWWRLVEISGEQWRTMENNGEQQQK